MIKIPQLSPGLEEAVKKAPLIVGIGPSAWPRVISGYYFPKFKILCNNDCQDNEYIREAGIDVYSLKQVDPYMEVSPVTPGKIIGTPLAKQFLNNLGEPFALLIYKSMGSFEKVCRQNGWSFIGNKQEVRDKYEDKRIFRETLREIGIDPIPWENLPIEDLTPDKFTYFQEKFGQKNLVLQIAEATWGGGAGTLFIDNAGDISKFHTRVAEIRKALEGKKKVIETVNVSPFIDGISASIPCCTTRYGVLTGSIQTQIVDIAEAGAVQKGRSGIFAGHDWGLHKFDIQSQDQADQLGQRFGDYLYKQGYKGIFGLDIIVTKTGKVWPVECNPRETDAFPLICMLQMEGGAIPMQVFHNLEHLDIDYSVDFETINKSYKSNYDASQILLYNKSDKYAIDRNVPRAGVYKIVDHHLEFVRKGFAIWDLEGDDEFLLTEDIAKIPGTVYEPHERMHRIIKRGGMFKKTDGGLRDDVKEMLKLMYQALKLVPVENGLVDRQGLKILYTNKLIEARKSLDIKEADVVNVIKDTGSGFYRPLSISWRRRIEQGPVLEQIRSKRARKQIASDLKRVKEMGIEISTIEEIDKEVFLEWFDLYQSIISSKSKGDVVITKEWFDEKKKKSQKIGGIIARRGGKIIGGDIFFEVNGILGVGYGVAERVGGLLGGLGMLLDYYFLEYAKSANYKEVSFGQDTNFYGYDLSCGLIAYKAKLGFHPVPANKTYWVTTYLLNVDKFNGPIMFFSGKDGNLKLTVVANKKESIDLNMYLPDQIELDDCYSQESILKQHRDKLL